MSDLDPQPAETQGTGLQESLFGRQELAPYQASGFEDLGSEGPPSGTFLPFDPTGAVSGSTAGRAAHQQLLYGGAFLTHLFSEPESTAPGHHTVPGWEDKIRETAENMTPQPGTQGFAAQSIYGLTSFATQVAMGGGGGGIATVGALSAYEAYHNAKNQGLDDETAQKMALLEGGTGSIFAGLPFGKLAENAALGIKLLASAGAGVTANTGLGALSRYGNNKILADAGYQELAEQYKPLDAQSMMIDAATGLFPVAHEAVGAFAGKAKAMLLHAALLADQDGRVRDAVSTAADARAARERAPGPALTPEAGAAHNQAELTALAQTLAGHGIDLGDTSLAHEDAAFLQAPEDTAQMRAAHEVFAQVLNESFADAPPELREATAADRAEATAAGQPYEAPEAAPSSAAAAPEADPFAEEPAKPLPKRNSKTPDAREDSVMQYLSKHSRGLSSDEARAQGIDPKEIGRFLPGTGKRVFRKKGMSFDEASEALSQGGVEYPVGSLGGNRMTVLDAIQSELNGRPVHSTRNTRIALEDEAALRDRAEIDHKVPEARAAEPEEKDMAALETKARAVDNDRATEIMESWEKDTPEEIARVRAQLEEVVHGGGEQSERGENSERTEGGGRPDVGQASEAGAPATTESLRTPAERGRAETDAGSADGFSATGSATGDGLGGRDAAVAREVIAERDKVREGLAALLDRAGRDMAMDAQAQEILDDMAERGISPVRVSMDFWWRDGTYDRLSADGKARFDKMANSLTGWEPGSVLSTKEGEPHEVAKDWKDVGQTLTHTFPNDPDKLEGTERGYVAAMKWANDAAAKLDEAPQPLAIVDANGNAHPAADALDSVEALEKQAKAEADKAFTSAVDCARRQA